MMKKCNRCCPVKIFPPWLTAACVSSGLSNAPSWQLTAAGVRWSESWPQAGGGHNSHNSHPSLEQCSHKCSALDTMTTLATLALLLAASAVHAFDTTVCTLQTECGWTQHTSILSDVRVTGPCPEAAWSPPWSSPSRCPTTWRTSRRPSQSPWIPPARTSPSRGTAPPRTKSQRYEPILLLSAQNQLRHTELSF